MQSGESQKKATPANTSAHASFSSSPNVDSSPQQTAIDPLAPLTPANALDYQRLFGNQSVLRMMRQSGQGLVQRDESAELLKKLAVPQIKPGPEVAAQKALVKALNASDDFKGGILNLGGILFDSALGKDKDLATQAKFMVLTGAVKGMVSAGFLRSQQLKDHGLVPLLLQNILGTMIDAQQVQYLRLAGLPNAEWKILVEVHYYRERDMSQTGFHKDTLGETLFVNLNYDMERTVVAPEIVVNPTPSQSHDEQTQNTLPPKFRQDLQTTRDELGAPTEYATGIANPYEVSA